MNGKKVILSQFSFLLFSLVACLIFCYFCLFKVHTVRENLMAVLANPVHPVHPVPCGSVAHDTAGAEMAIASMWDQEM